VVTHETDFLDLYRRLGLNPGCGMAELKQAYRRHVAALHPDRQQGRPTDARTASRLQRLNAQYGAAMEFHRRYGRLPGAPQAASPGAHSGTREVSSTAREMPDPFAASRDATFSRSAEQAEPSHAAHRSHGRVALLLVILALGVLGWTMHTASLTASSANTDEDTTSQPGAGSVSHETAGEGVMLHMGMSGDEVRALEGNPLAMHGDLWEYGPSWIRFEHDEVVEWHSSPLHPLHTEAHAASDPTP
jgi:DnaJ-class molecular chaperone